MVLQACNGTSTPVTQATTLSNISGDYIGNFADVQSSSVTPVTGTLAQHGSSAGGSMINAAGTLNAHMSLVIDSSNTVTGSIVINKAATACTYSTTGTYDPANNIINGSYAAVTNCAGDTGTYVLNQQCTDTVTSVEKRTALGLTKC